MVRGKRGFSIGVVALLVGVLAFGVVPASAQQALAQGEHRTVTTEVAPFTSIQINGGGEATLAFGPKSSVTIEGNSMVVDRLDAKVENGELILGSLATVATTLVSDLTYTIVTPSIDAIHLNGTVELDVLDLPAQPALELGLTTGAEVTVDGMQVDAVTGKLDLLSTAHLSGSADTMQLEVNNGSTLDAGDLQVGSADLTLNGVAHATVRVTDALTGRAAQGSTISYISQTVQPELELTTMASVEQLPYTVWAAEES